MKSKYNIENPMAPLWLMYPHIRRYSIGWRMGYGENYAYEFGNWFSALTTAEQKEYQEMFPEPKGWLGWYAEEYEDNDIYNDSYLLWSRSGKLKYSTQGIIESIQNGEHTEFLFFWGHQPSANGRIIKSCLSQWWMSDFAIDIDKYCCMEHYMMAEKARIFGDNEILDKIMESNNPKQIKDLGRKVRNFNEDIWKLLRQAIILNGNFAKFLQNDSLKDFLIETGNKVIIEASPYDSIWGIGMTADEKGVDNPLEWKGQNLLGFALMEVRDELIRVCKNDCKLNLEELHKEFD